MLRLVFLAFAVAGVCGAFICSCGYSQATPSLVNAEVALTADAGAKPAYAENKNEEILLNGVWDFQANSLNPQLDWQRIYVPGTWKSYAYLPGFVSDAGSQFRGPINRGFYRRQITAPAGWKGDKILLRLSRVSTDARVLLNGKEQGDVLCPSGDVDISKDIKLGEPNELIILVANEESSSRALEQLSQPPDAVPAASGKTSLAGLVGNVSLVRRRNGARIGALITNCSVRQKNLDVDVVLSNVATEGAAKFIVEILDAAGAAVGKFSTSANLQKADRQIVRLKSGWMAPKLWDPEHPNVYKVNVSVDSPSVKDTSSCSFGFREVWPDGRKIMLNGKEIALRPISIQGGIYTEAGWSRQHIEGVLTGLKKFGFNCVEIWPSEEERGTFANEGGWLEVADKKGMLLMVQPPSPKPFLQPPRIDDYQKELVYKKSTAWANHPSLFMLTTLPNSKYGPAPNPLAIGREMPFDSREKNEKQFIDLINSSTNIPTFAHGGFNLGNIFTLNQYLNWVPLQEREEFMSKWCKDGTMPYMAVEFGMPLIASYLRARTKYHQAIKSEPLITEYAAVYSGKNAYANETPEYRNAIVTNYESGQSYKGWHNNVVLAVEPNYQDTQELFVRNTWRTWRSMGVSGGMVPWDFLNSCVQSPMTHTLLAPPASKDEPPVDKKLALFLQPAGGWKLRPSGDVLNTMIQPTLAWIAGDSTVPEPSTPPFESFAFAAKDHHFRAGRAAKKEIALVNDLSDKQNYSASVKVMMDSGATLLEKTFAGQINPCSKSFLPFAFTLPQVSAPAGGSIELKATVGALPFTDKFVFKVYPGKAASPSAVKQLNLLDPAGRTSKLFQSLGVKFAALGGADISKLQAGSIVVVGRDALTSGVSLSNLRSFVQNGGTLLCFNQNPDALKSLGFRTCRQVARRVFPVSADHPLARNFDNEDLRDWNGFSDLKASYDQGPLSSPKEMYARPLFCWHWGNRGGVSSAAVEKPHYGGWTPVLETEFDLAYSPLMEMRFGKGRIILSLMDVDERAGIEPVAENYCLELLRYASQSQPAAPFRTVAYLGGPVGTAMLNEFGVRTNAKVADKPDLLFVGDDVDAADPSVTALLARGGTAFFLPRKPGQHAGVTVAARVFNGTGPIPSLDLFKGISASDVHWRTSNNGALIVGGCDTYLNGLVGIKKAGPGKMIFCQINPAEIMADDYTFLRLTRWRQTRTLSQILANLGLDLAAGERLFVSSATTPLYHKDYIDYHNEKDPKNFIFSDDPYRFYPW